tara:strand:+ start:1335 stop:1781 length:447 start_codon:yes stop_codon:yes gene_type:complete
MTNIVEQLGGQEAMEGMARDLIGEFGWIFVAGVAVLMFRELVQNFAAGLKVYFSKQWAVDEIVFLHGRQARIARIGLTETVFYMADRGKETGGAGTAMRIENTALASLTCEKILANHQPEYLPKGSEKLGPMKVEIVKTPAAPKRKRK